MLELGDGLGVKKMQRNEDFTFNRITKNYNKYFRGPKENETKYEEILCRKKRD